MEFLHPPKGDDHHVILLLVVSRDKRTRLLRYEWDSSKSLNVAEPMGFGQPVSKDEQLPLLLIPFTTSPGFLLVCEKVMATYQDILTGHANVKIVKLKPVREPEVPKEPGSSRRFPLWTHWARPMRRDDWESENDAIYLCREDGVVRFLEISANRDYNGLAKVGRLGINVDSAFASLDSGTREHDLLGAAGDMSDGGIFSFIPRKNAAKRQSIPSWTPVIDFVTVQDLSLSQRSFGSGGSRHRKRERVFACIGRGSEHGAVCELRFGIEAKSSARITIEEFLEAGVLGMWILPDMSGSGLFILITDPRRTVLFFVAAMDGDVTEISQDKTSIDLEARTLSAGSTREGLTIQITDHSIHAFPPFPAEAFEQNFQEEKIVAACVQGSIPAILIVIRKRDSLYLQGGIISLSGTGISLSGFGGPVRLSSESSSLSIQALGHQLYAFVATLDGRLQIYRTIQGQPLIPFIQHTFEGDFAICDSIAMISRSSNGGSQEDFAILCGLRNGSLHIFTLQAAETLGWLTTLFHDKHYLSSVVDDQTFMHRETILMGSTSVTVMPDTTSSKGQEFLCSRAIVVCGADVCRLEYAHNQRQLRPATINSIWLTDQEEPGFSQGPLTAIAQFDPWNCNRIPGLSNNLLFLIEKSNIHIAQLSTSVPQAIPRRIPIGGTPVRIIHLTRFNMLAVGLTKTTVKNNKRLVQSYLSFIGEDAIAAVEHHHSNSLKIGRPGERIMGILEWFPSEDGKSYHFIVVVTLRRHSPPAETGVVYLYRITRGHDLSVSTKLIRAMEPNSPVYSVASYGASSLVYSSGKNLFLHTLRLSDQKLQPPSIFLLSSPGVHISVQGSYIYVTTFENSVSIFKVEGLRLVPQFSDQEARAGLHHLTLPEHSIILASNKHRTMAGLWQPPKQRINNSTSTLFEAELPGSATRLRRGSLRPPWRNGSMSSSDAILSSSADGSFYQVELLDEASWRLLRFIQNMAVRNAVVCPFSYKGPHHRHIEPSTERRHYMQVDGDILLRLLERGLPDDTFLLRSMLEHEPDARHRLYDFDTAQARCERFSELVAAALGGEDNEDPVQAAVDYLRVVLQPVM